MRKCPFCNAELNKFGDGFPYQCPTSDCIMYAINLSDEIWRALLDGKKAQEALDYTIRYLKSCRRHKWDISYSNVCTLIERIENKEITEPRVE